MKLFLICCTFALSCSTTWGQEVKDASSHFRPAVLNSEAWQSGDFLIKTTRTCDATSEDEGKLSGAFFNQDELVRVVFDESFQKASCYRHRTETVTDFDDGSKESKFVFGSSVSFDFELDTWSFFYIGNGEFKSKVGKIGSEMRREVKLLMHDVRGFWFDGNTELGSFSRVQKLVEASKAWESDRLTFQNSNKNLKMKLETEIMLGQHSQPAEQTYVFSNETLMPVSSKFERFYQSRKLLFESVKFEWAEKDDLYVPMRLQRIDPNFTIERSKNSVFGEAVTESRFHWFVFNDDVSDELIDASKIKTLKDIVALTDPKKNNATTLSKDKNEAEKK